MGKQITFFLFLCFCPGCYFTMGPANSSGYVQVSIDSSGLSFEVCEVDPSVGILDCTNLDIP